MASLEVVGEDYERSVVAGFTVVVGAAGLLASTTYRWVFEDLLKLMLTELHSYLVVALLSVFVVLYYALRTVGLSYELRPSKVIASALLLSLGVALYLGSRVDPTYSLQLGTASFVMVFLSLVVLAYRPTSPRDVVPLLSPLILVPVPAELADAVTPALSRFVGVVVSALTGSRLVEGPGYAKIEVATPQGPALLDIQVACTGVVTVSSVLAVVPVLTYLAAFSPRSWFRKATSVAISVATALLIGTLGNLVRVLLVVLGSSRVGVDFGMNLFHYSPSVVYSSLSVLAAFLVADRLGGVGSAVPRVLMGRPRVRWDFVSGVLVAVLALTVAYQAVAYYVAALEPPRPGAPGLVVEVEDLESFIEETPRYVLRGTKLVSYRYDPYLASILGALRVYEVSVVAGGELYRGYVEVADTPARFHTWQICLTAQGYRVLNSWVTVANSTLVHLIEVEKGGSRGVLAHTTIPAYLLTPSGTSVAYLRISLMKPLRGAGGDVVGEVSRVLQGITYGSSPQGVEVGGLAPWATASYVLLASLAIYAVAVASHPLVGMLRRLFTGSRGVGG